MVTSPEGDHSPYNELRTTFEQGLGNDAKGAPMGKLLEGATRLDEMVNGRSINPLREVAPDIDAATRRMRDTITDVRDSIRLLDPDREDSSGKVADVNELLDTIEQGRQQVLQRNGDTRSWLHGNPDAIMSRYGGDLYGDMDGLVNMIEQNAEELGDQIASVRVAYSQFSGE